MIDCIMASVNIYFPAGKCLQIIRQRIQTLLMKETNTESNSGIKI